MHQEFTLTLLSLKALCTMFSIGPLLLQEASELGQRAMGLFEHAARSMHSVPTLASKLQRILYVSHMVTPLLELLIHLIHSILDAKQSLLHEVQFGILRPEFLITLGNSMSNTTKFLLDLLRPFLHMSMESPRRLCF